MMSSRPLASLLKSGSVVVALGSAAFCGFNVLHGSEKFYADVVMPLVCRTVDPEKAHKFGVKLANFGIPAFGSTRHEYAELETKAFGMTFKNPIGLAAGFDKNGTAVTGLLCAGYGFVEVGSITPLPQPGNDQPRVFRLPEDQAVINRYGFNSDGAAVVKDRLSILSGDRVTKLGINLGKNKLSGDPVSDYVIGTATFGDLGDYLVVNVSSPNTPGLRNLQQKSQLEQLLKALKDQRDKLSKPTILLLKVSPDLTLGEQKDIADVCLNKKYNVQGLIISNTTLSRPSSLKAFAKDETGGLSGRPLKDLSTQSIREFYRLTKGQLKIIGCGGVFSGADAYEKIRAGASLVQIYTALVFLGPPVLGKIKRELVECLRRDNFTSVEQAIGADYKK